MHKVDSVSLFLLHFKKLVFKWCLSTLNYPVFLVPLGWKIFFVAPCYYLSLSENLDLLASHLLRKHKSTLLPTSFLPSWWETIFQTSFRRADRCTVVLCGLVRSCKTQRTWGMGEKSPSPGKAMSWSPSRCWREWPWLSPAF